MSWLVKRLAEPSSWAGASVLAASGGVILGDVAAGVASGAPWYVAAGASVLAILLGEKGRRG